MADYYADQPINQDALSGSSYYSPSYYTPSYTPNFSGLSNSQATQSVGNASNAAAAADPFASQRGQYQTDLSNVISNPGSITSSPYYQFARDQGLNAIQRQGTVRSGNKLAQLMQFGTGLASQNYNSLVSQLTPLSGATTGSPATAGNILNGGFNRSQDQRQIGAAQGAAANNPYNPYARTAAPQNGAPMPGSNPYASQNSNALSGTYDPYGLNGQSGGYDPYGDPYTDSLLGLDGSSGYGGGTDSWNDNSMIGNQDLYSPDNWDSGGMGGYDLFGDGDY